MQEELLETVETQKDAALQYTLKTVAKNLREILKTIVYPGRGFVRWVYDNDVDDELQNALVKNLALPFSFSLCHITLIIVLVKCQSLQEPDVMQLRGVAIDVSFDNEKRKDLKSLSGGQQSVVSLALFDSSNWPRPFLLVWWSRHGILSFFPSQSIFTLFLTILETHFRPWIAIIVQRWPNWWASFLSAPSSSFQLSALSCCGLPNASSAYLTIRGST